MKCPICAEEIRDNSNFCGKCGSRIPRCPTCGTVIYQRLRFCLNDGTPLPEDVLSLLPAEEPTPAAPAAAPLNVADIASLVLSESEPDGEQTQPIQVPKADPEEPTVYLPRSRFCLECGRPCAEGERFCDDCKARLARPIPPTVEGSGRRKAEKKRGGISIILIVLVMLLLLLALGFAVYVAYSNGLIGPQPKTSDTADRADEDEEKDDEADGQDETADKESGEDDATEKSSDDAAAPAVAPAAEAADQPAEEPGQASEEPVQQSPPAEPEQPAETTAEAPAEEQIEHTYELVKADVTWMEARDACLEKGGHLATITSQEEYEQVCALVNGQGLKYLWLGACLKSDDDTWGNSNWITGEDWTFDNWYPGEPSLIDTGDGTREYFLCMWYAKYNGSEIGWTFNDQRNDIIEVLPSIKGTVGYVCEYENGAAE